MSPWIVIKVTDDRMDKIVSRMMWMRCVIGLFAWGSCNDKKEKSESDSRMYPNPVTRWRSCKRQEYLAVCEAEAMFLKQMVVTVSSIEPVFNLFFLLI